MFLSDLLTRALALLASKEQPGAFEALEAAAMGDSAAFAEALEFLDGLTPEVSVAGAARYPTSTVSFLQWVDGVKVHATNRDMPGELVVFSYGPTRSRADVLELLGRGCVMLTRREVA